MSRNASTRVSERNILQHGRRLPMDQRRRLEMNPLKRYQDSVRALDKAEADFQQGMIDAKTLQEARIENDEARAAWNATHEKLTEPQRIKLAAETAKENKEPENELMLVKTLLKKCRQKLQEARENNKVLYAQLKANRELKKTLNEEYATLRERKKDLTVTAQ